MKFFFFKKTLPCLLLDIKWCAPKDSSGRTADCAMLVHHHACMQLWHNNCPSFRSNFNLGERMLSLLIQDDPLSTSLQLVVCYLCSISSEHRWNLEVITFFHFWLLFLFFTLFMIIIKLSHKCVWLVAYTLHRCSF